MVPENIPGDGRPYLPERNLEECRGDRVDKHHWLEEAQHAKIDALELKKLSTGAPAEQIDKAVDDYLGILEAFSGLLGQQGELDAKSLARALGRTFSEEEDRAIAGAQGDAYRRSLITMGIENQTFQRYLGQFSEEGRSRVNARMGTLS